MFEIKTTLVVYVIDHQYLSFDDIKTQTMNLIIQHKVTVSNKLQSTLQLELSSPNNNQTRTMKELFLTFFLKEIVININKE